MFEIPLLIVAVAVGLYMAVNIGANDVANAMGTSVGARSLSLRKAVILAATFSFFGALLLGSYVTETISKGVIDSTYFVDKSVFLIYGMIAVLLGSSIWITLATYLKLPISTTHSVIGALIGFGLIGPGAGGINWRVVGNIVLSWIFSPMIGALVAYLLFIVIKKRILDVASPLKSLKKEGPLLLSIVLFILSIAFIGGSFKRFSKNFTLSYTIGISLGVAIVGGMGAYFSLKKYSLNREDEYEKVEDFSKILQVLSASYEAFALGTNDVANAVGPLAAIFSALKTGHISTQVYVSPWVPALGGAGLVIGISIWGYRVMETIGKKITEVTPTRGFVAEFSAASVVLVCSRLGMPISTTHASVGAVIGIGMARGVGALNLRVIRNIIFSWLFTLPIAAGLTMGVYKIFIII
ncbi:MAG: inorganic phosphate transporter [Candidatus Aerophobetes bacterium]|nr:inorganic phosphate transporter [Candidatus Aerophobetes bacterium]